MVADVVGTEDVLGQCPEQCRGPDAWPVVLTDGERVLVRAPRPDDAESLQAMHLRCSPASLCRRYLGSASRAPAVLLPVLLGLSPDSVALVAEARDRRLVALANLFTNDDATGDVALLVEDSWQRRGLGTALVRRLAAEARDRGLHALTVVTVRSNDAPARLLARAGLSVEVGVADGLRELRALLTHGAGARQDPNELNDPVTPG